MVGTEPEKCNPDSRQDEQISQIRFIIYGARKIFARDIGPPKALYTVFSLGSEKYITDTVTSHHPNWIESQTFNVLSTKVPLRVWVKIDSGDGENDVCVGRTTIPIYCLPKEEQSKELIAKLHPGNGSQTENDPGFIAYECYVTKFKPRSDWGIVEWIKEQAPRVVDYLYNEDLPTCSVLCNPCNKRIAWIIARPEGGTRNKQECSPPDPLVLKKMVQIIMTQPGIQNLSTDVQNMQFPDGTAMTLTEEEKHMDSLFPKVRSNSREQKNSFIKLPHSPNIQAIKRKLSRRRSHSFSDLKLSCFEEHSMSVPNAPSVSSKTAQNPFALLANFAKSFGGTNPEESSPEVINDNRLNVFRDRANVKCNSMDNIHRPSIEITDALGMKHTIAHVKSLPLGGGPCPLITQVVPDQFSVDGGERLEIIGSNLGLCPNDVESLFVCGSNLVSTLEWHSPSSCFCTTKPWRSCIGTVNIVTRSGGKTSSSPSVQFIEPHLMFRPTARHLSRGNSGLHVKHSVMYDSDSAESSYGPKRSDIEGISTDDELDPDEIPYYPEDLDGVKNDAPSSQRSAKVITRHESYLLLRTVNEWTQTTNQSTSLPQASPVYNEKYSIAKNQNQYLKETIDMLQDELSELKVENAGLRAYVDDLVSRVLAQVPDALCVDEHIGRERETDT